jgi:tRNA (cytidine/uridine-2'-O-)-methyltransferase
MRLALYQPDMPQNTGAMMRLCAAFGVPMDIIEPCGFVWHHPDLKRTGMDYTAQVVIEKHLSWQHFLDWRAVQIPAQPRLILLTTKGARAYTDFAFEPTDILLVGRESAGVPDYVHEAADARVVIPIHARSLNVGMSAAIVLAESLRQTALKL